MNYEDMSDFEVNGAVAAIVTGGDVIEKYDMAEAPTADGVQVVYKVGVHGEFLDYCNNPSDAWPIVVDNEITIAKHVSNDEWEAYGGGYEVNYDHEIESCRDAEFMDKNPLRAAMICFLKMKDTEK